MDLLGREATPSKAKDAGGGAPDEQEAERPLTPEEREAAEFLEKHLGGVMPRDPAGIVAALAELQRRRLIGAAKTAEKTSKQPATKEQAAAVAAEQLRLRLAVGDWEALRSLLSQAPAKVAPHVYLALLQLLAAGHLLPDDVLMLADLAPGEWTESQLALLGQMLSQSAKQLGTPHVALARLREGTRRLGGKNAANRLAAARLLLNAKLVTEAGEYLPPPEAVLKSGEPDLLNLSARYHQALAAKTGQKEPLLVAWRMTQLVLDGATTGSAADPAPTPTASETQLDEALRRMAQLIDKLPEAAVAPWLRTTFRQRPALAWQLVQRIARQLEATWRGKEPEKRLEAHQMCHRALRALWAETAGKQAEWKPAVELLLLYWHRDAQYTAEQTAATALPDHQPQLPAEGLLKSGPEEDWYTALSPDAGRSIRRLAAKLAVQSADEPRTLAALPKIAAFDGKLANELAGKFLEKWSQDLRSPGRDVRDLDDMRFSLSRISLHRDSSREGIPLTRAKQERNLKRLAQLLQALRAAGATGLDQHAVIGAFDVCHSPAEVYREDDLRTIFGDPAQQAAEAVAAVAGKMREQLAQQWRRPDVQEQMSTNRTPADQVAEIQRGYGLATRWLEPAVERFAGQPELKTLLAKVYFDQAEFLYGQQVDLETYGKLRDRAFATHRQSAQTYKLALPKLPSEEQSVAVYLEWFQAALGASDLAYLRRQDAPERDQIERIAAAIRSLGAAADAHVELFARQIAEVLHEAPPPLKPRFLRESLRVVGDHTAGRQIAEILQLYDELLHEIEFHAALDGSGDVGHQRPFGVHLMIRNSQALGRESQGFAELLTASGQPRGSNEQRQKLEQEIRDKWGKAFQIEVLRFHEPTITARRFGREGWEQTPLAYLVLRARDAAVDRLPPLQLDLEFQDGRGSVLLPIVSSETLVNAGGPRPAPRPCRDIKVKQVLDDRRLAEGRLRLEITATGMGLLPELDDLLDLGATGLPGTPGGNVEANTQAAVQDHGLDIGALDATGAEVVAMCTRSWTVDFDADAKTLPSEFTFPPPRLAATATHQRYADADVIEVGQVVPLPRGAARHVRWLAWTLGVLVVAVLAATMLWLARRHRAAPAGPRYHPPRELTPFSLLGLLQRIRDDTRVPLAPAARQSLNQTIARLEQGYFSSGAETMDTTDLPKIVAEWLSQANGATDTPAIAVSASPA